MNPPAGKTHAILHYSSVFFIIGGVALLVPGAVTLMLDPEPVRGSLAAIFLGTGLISLAIGFVTSYIIKRPDRIGLDAALGTAALGWLVLALVGSMPYMLAYDAGVAPNPGLSPVDAFFESMSGFTATGLTMYPAYENITLNGTWDMSNIDLAPGITNNTVVSGMHAQNGTTNVTIDSIASLPRGILFWRSLTQWIGGVGVIVLFLSILIRSSGIAARLYKAEGRTDRIAPTIVSTARRIWLIYALYTGLCFIGLAILSMRVENLTLFDSVNISMTALATGGFATTADSIASYPWPVALFIIPFMLIGGISFVCHKHLLKGRLRGFFSIEVVAMLIIFFVVSGLLMFRHSALDSAFQVASALTGTGFSSVSLGEWPDFSKFMLTIMMILGGGYGSTASALKMIRVIIIFYAIAWVVKKALYSRNAIIPFKVHRKVYPEEEVRRVTIYFTLYIFVLVLGAVVFMAYGNSAADSLFEVASAEGNVGLSVGLTGPNMPLVQKVVLITEMYVGRLEIFPILVLLAIPFKKFR